MADLPSLLAVIEHDPDDTQALEALAQAARSAPSDVRATRLAASRKTLATKGRPDAVVALLDIELAATPDGGRKADLLIEKGMVLDAELLDVPGARAAFEQVMQLRQGDPMAKEALDDLAVAEQNWTKFAAKFVQEATASTDRGLLLPYSCRANTATRCVSGAFIAASVCWNAASGSSSSRSPGRIVNNSRASSGRSRAKQTAATAIATAASAGVSPSAASALVWKRSSARSHAAVRMPSRLPKR